MNIEDNLQNLGMSPAESAVYLALTKTGKSRAGKVISMTNLSSSNAHQALEKLVKRGLISFIVKNGIKEYAIGDAQHLKYLVDSEKVKLKEKEETLRKTLEVIKSISQISSQNQNAEVYVGLNGIKSAFKKLLLPIIKSENYVFFYKYNKDNYEIVHDFFSRMDKEGSYRSIPTRGIFSSEYKKLFYTRKNKIKAKFTDSTLPSSINIYCNKSLIVSWGKKPVAFLIDSLEISSMFKEMFNEMWLKN